uniref:Serpin family A member 1 n=1 Tax=Molossus molossus TaxID=27622 RepID=A0A7J8K0D0_MOLMO|nr:serpin family A member 1 [Molossus molossus]
MPSSTWGLLLLAGLNCLAPASLIQEEDTLLHDHEKHNYKIAPNMADFAYTLYRQVAHQSSTTNIFISPLSIAQAFVILAMGATGETHTQIMDSINMNMFAVPDAEVYHLIWFLLNQTRTQLTSSNMLFIDSNLKTEVKFLEDIRKLYYSKVFSINFRDAGAQKQINDYIEKETQGNTVDLVKEFDNNTSLALMGKLRLRDRHLIEEAPGSFILPQVPDPFPSLPDMLLHLSPGQWKDTFESEHLVGNFHVDKKTTIRGPMTQYFGKFHVLYDKKLSSWVVLQHYMGNPAFLFMPKQGMIQQLEARLCRRELARIRRGIKNRSASLLLPKLSISGTYDLETFLGKLGIARVFSNGAELSGISEEVPLKLSKALHKAVMTIDDNVKEHSGDSLLKKEKEVKHVTIKFNRPFLVYIMDETLSFPLFMGRMVKPPGK